jgi:thiamine-phosphate pyrophosphorylase
MQTPDSDAGGQNGRETRTRLRNARLYILITESLCRFGWFETAAEVLAGGADVLQLREKALPDRELLRRARRLAALCREYDAVCIINDRPDIALLCGADGVHLGQDDVTVAQARRIVPAEAILGISTHTLEQAKEAVAAAPDYLAVGPMFATSTKPQDHIAGPETLAAVQRQCSLPLVAIGGIDQTNAPTVLAAAPCCLCVCRAVVSHPDPRAATSALRAAVDRSLHGTPSR